MIDLKRKEYKELGHAVIVMLAPPREKLPVGYITTSIE
jgi:hypothetical protein